jgi:hypothetical protein
MATRSTIARNHGQHDDSDSDRKPVFDDPNCDDTGGSGLRGTGPASQPSLANFWVSEGPGPGINGQETVAPNNQINGAIQAIAVNPTDPDVMYVGSVNGGIWKTTNATAAAPHWVPLTDNLPSLSIGALEFDPTDPTHQTLIAGIGATSSNRVHDTAFTGVLRTTDGGATWSQLGTTTANLGGESITSVAARGTTLLAAADNGWAVQDPGLGKGLFRSTDSGVTWTLISDGAHGLPNSQSVSDVVGDPLNSNVLYAAVTGTGGGVFKSIDTGLTWTNISSGIGIIGSTTDKIELAVHHDATNLDVFATVDNGGVLSGVFRSANGGSFVALDVPSGGASGDIFGAIAADPVNPNIAYVGYGEGSSHYLTRIDASKPSGSQITDISGGSFGSPHVDVREMQIDANGNLILGTDGGLFRLPTPTGNAGVWRAIVGDIGVFEVHSIAYDDISHTIMVGTQDNGTLFQQTPGGATWDQAAGGDGGDVVIDDVSLAAFGESIRYFSSQNLLGWTRQVYDSANHTVSTTLLSPISDSQFTTPVELNFVDPTRLLVGGSGNIYESKDQGTTLTAIANAAVNGISFNGGGVMVYGGFQNGVADPDLIYAASEANVLRQTASGGGFTTTSPGGSTIRGVTDNPTNWAAVFTIDNDQVFESTNAGATWVDVTANLASISATDFRSIEYVHGAVDDALVVGTSSGVFYARVSGLGGAASWNKFGSNLPDVIVYDLEYDATDNVLVAGTLGRGAWQVNNATTNLGIDARVPAAPIFNALAVAADNGALGDTFTAGGTGVAGDTITLLDGGTVVGTTTVAANGTWSLTTSSLASGSHTLSATQADAHGTSAPSLSMHATIRLGTPNTVSLVGTAASDSLSGGAGNDTMNGAAGNDFYRVNRAGDVVIEAAGEGTDRVLTSVSYGLTPGQSIETLSTIDASATTAINLRGNEFANVLTGNAGNNTLDGLGGADSMKGGLGNDTYIVDTAGDLVTELAGQGTDTVKASVSRVLGNNCENLTLTGFGNINGTGNALVNTLLGNSGNNILDGKASADTMRGGAGNDTYVVDNAGDLVVELASQGTDTVRSSVSYTLSNNIENLTLAGVGNISGTGNALVNTVLGNNGANLINGMAGSDTLRGLGGSDSFRFSTAFGAGNIDHILDYNVAADTIQLENAVFTGLAGGTLAAGAFFIGAAAHDADDRIIYNATNGALFFDSNGSAAGGAVQFATVTVGLAMTSNEFFVT